MRRAAVRLALGLAMVCGAASSSFAQTVPWHRFDPLVIPSTFTQPVRLEAAVNGSASRVALELSTGAFIEMRDDGTGGDSRGGDGVFTVSIPASTILSALRADDVQRVFVGFLTLFNGATSVFRGNMFADVHTPDVGTFNIVRLSPDAQATSRVLNIVDPQYLSDFSVRRVAQTFYRLYGDEYDFLNIISTPSRFANRTHTIVRNGRGAARARIGRCSKAISRRNDTRLARRARQPGNNVAVFVVHGARGDGNGNTDS
jgi:hypothetical protein